jgi:hypothetical protein
LECGYSSPLSPFSARESGDSTEMEKKEGKVLGKAAMNSRTPKVSARRKRPRLLPAVPDTPVKPV